MAPMLQPARLTAPPTDSDPIAMTRQLAHRALPAPAAGPGPLLAALLLTSGLAGCGGGSAGDAVTGGGEFTPNPVAPLVGTWGLDGNWNGSTGGEALLVIPPLEEDGSSEARLYELDSTAGNCYFRPDRGIVEPDPLRETQAFMNGIFPFSDAIVARDGSTLIITYFDTENTGCQQDGSGRCVYRAESVALLESDIQVCEL